MKLAILFFIAAAGTPISSLRRSTFASELLFPAKVLREEWPSRLTITAMLPLKQKWGMSLAAMIEHAYRLRVVSSAERLSFFKQMSNRRDPITKLRWREREPGWEDREVEVPKVVGQILQTAFGADSTPGSISRSAYSWPPRLIAQVCAGQGTAWSRAAAQKLDQERVAPVLQLRPHAPKAHSR